MTRLLIVAVIVAVAIVAVRYPASAPPGLAAAPPVGRLVASRTGANHAWLVVYVAGAVKRSGLYRFRDGARVDDAVRAAGGLTSDADPVATNLASRLRDGDEVAVRRVGEILPSRSGRKSSKTGRKRKSPKAEPQSVDVNHADAATIATLPSIGPALAQRIVAFRELNGPFVSLDDLGDVAGMTTARIDAVAPYVNLH
ncbi:MAG: ComEA family DNA-binding protein [Candidatus Eremiobacteraeota bacterium]|nr:ComEA family DNA-binding protein [Candidatus Eremiobacteraeota bacterium]